MTAVIAPRQVRDDIREFSRSWWLFLITGLAWIFIAFFILQFDIDSIWTISLMFSFILILSGLNEFVAMVTSTGWRWLHGLLGVILVAGGVWAIAYPGQTFGTLALLFGWMVLFKGTFDVVAALSSRDVDLWWLTLIVGVLEIALAFWALEYPGRSAALLVFWVGFGALLRGMTEIVLAFQVRSLGQRVAA